MYARLTGTGAYLPAQVLTNYDLEKRLDTSHDWIVERTGIVERRIAGEDETTTQMAVQAAELALKAAKLSPKDIGLIIVATCTPDKIFPSTACLVQKHLGIPPCAAFDVQAACSGFLYALTTADRFIKTAAIKHALVIGSEVMSRIVDWSDRSTCVLFGDGAGAIVLSADKAPGILSCYISADGNEDEVLYLNNQPDARLQMQGNAVFRLAVNRLDKMAAATLKRQHIDIAEIDWLIPHQANLRIIQSTAQKLGLPLEKVITTVQTQGNTSSASIPLALDSAIQENKLKSGQHLLLEAFGGGLTFGTALIKY